MQITSELIERLLYEEEGTTLDFKRDQYPFENATKEEKSELLKDVLAFTNAFRRSDAFILIGVEESKGGRSNVVGVTSQLDDAKLQQFVNSKTQRPITFSYREAEHDGLPIGIIHIPLQRRPVHTVTSFGKLIKAAVYVRHGSSTAIASPDEIAQMGALQSVPEVTEPSFTFNLFDRATGKTIGEELSLHCTWLQIPSEKDIPDYCSSYNTISIGENRGYYRELAKFTHTVHFYRPVSLAITNTGSVTAHDVRLVFEIDDPQNEYVFLEEYDIPEPPKSQDLLFLSRGLNTRVYNSDISVARTGDTWRVECLFGKIQPRDTGNLVSDLYVASHQTGSLVMNAFIYADNISSPYPVRFQLNMQADIRTVSLEDIEKMEGERFLNTEEGKKMLEESSQNEQ